MSERRAFSSRRGDVRELSAITGGERKMAAILIVQPEADGSQVGEAAKGIPVIQRGRIEKNKSIRLTGELQGRECRQMQRVIHQQPFITEGAALRVTAYGSRAAARQLLGAEQRGAGGLGAGIDRPGKVARQRQRILAVEPTIDVGCLRPTARDIETGIVVVGGELAGAGIEGGGKRRALPAFRSGSAELDDVHGVIGDRDSGEIEVVVGILEVGREAEVALPSACGFFQRYAVACADLPG